MPAIPIFKGKNSLTMAAEETIQFEKILNFRDFSQGSKESIVAKRFFRGGYLHKATASDIKKLDQLGIKTLIDMRSAEEARYVYNPHMDEVFKVNKYLLGKGKVRTQVPLWRIMSNVRLLIDQKGYGALASVPMHAFRRSRDRIVQVFTSPFNSINLIGMYKYIIKYHSNEIKEVLEHFTDEQNYPILIFCSLGKDRTGIMSALISEMVGIPREVTVQEYSKSCELLHPAKDEILGQTRQLFLGDWIIESPVEVMREFLQFIDQQYGSVSQFLTSIGFGKEKQDKVRTLLLRT